MSEELLQPSPLDRQPEEGDTKSKRPKPSGLWWFILLVLIGLIVIWSLSEKLSTPSSPQQPSIPLPTVTPTPDPALRAEAEAALENALKLVGPLRATEPERWANEAWKEIEEGMSMGDAQMAAKQFSAATDSYGSVLPSLKRLTNLLPGLPDKLLPQAITAYSKGAKEEAVALLNIILFLAPENQQAKDLLPRAEVSDQSYSVLQTARKFADQEEWDLAWAESNRLNSLDPLFPGGSSLKERVADALSQEEFQKWISQALSAVDNQDLLSAQSLLDKAAGYNPEHPSVIDLNLQIQNELLQQKVLNLKKEAETLESKEAWAAAHKVWLKMKVLDPDAPWIQTGLDQSLKWKQVEVKLERSFKNLGSKQTAEWVAEFEQRENWPAGLDTQAQRLIKEWRLATTPVSVTLISDFETRVQISRIGRWKPFKEKQLNLVPGTYVAEGIRLGYRDVRVPFEVKPGQKDLEVTVICQERI